MAVALHQSVATVSEGDKVRQCPVHPSASSHDLGQCRGFAQMPIDERSTIAKESGMCFNCLGGKHSSPQCKLKSQCNICDAFHHALLHRDRQQKASGSASQSGMRHDSVAKSKPKANVPTVGLVVTNGAAKEKIGIMKITAVVQSGDGLVNNFFSVLCCH